MPATGEKSIGRKIVTGLLLGMAIIVFVPLIGGIWFLSDNDRVRRTLEYVVGDFTGRALHINGDFDFSLGEEIVLKGQKIVWENPAWSSTPNIGESESIEVSFDTWSFIEPPVIISNVVASNTHLEFEWTDDDKFNWWFGDEDNEEPDERTDHIIQLLLDKADLTNTSIRFQHPQLIQPLLIEIPAAKQQQDPANHLQLDIDAVIDKRDIAIGGRLGSFPNLISGSFIDFELNLHVTYNTTHPWVFYPCSRLPTWLLF